MNMRRNKNPIDMLFDEIERELLSGPGPWSQRDIDEVISEGRRVERVNGETTEYYLDENGEWVEVEEDNDGDLLDFEKTSTGLRMTADVSPYLPTGDFTARAEVNNGVLEVAFESDEELDE